MASLNISFIHKGTSSWAQIQENWFKLNLVIKISIIIFNEELFQSILQLQCEYLFTHEGFVMEKVIQLIPKNYILL